MLRLHNTVNDEDLYSPRIKYIAAERVFKIREYPSKYNR